MRTRPNHHSSNSLVIPRSRKVAARIRAFNQSISLFVIHFFQKRNLIFSKLSKQFIFFQKPLFRKDKFRLKTRSLQKRIVYIISLIIFALFGISIVGYIGLTNQKTQQELFQNTKATTSQFTPLGGAIVTGTDLPANTAVAPAQENSNTGSWKGTLGDDDYYWIVQGTSAGANVQLSVGSVQLNGANTLIIQSEFDLDNTLYNSATAAAVLSTAVQICDFQSSAGVDNATDAQCTGGGWRSINNRKNAITALTSTAYHWQIYDGYFMNGSSYTATPLTNFINNNQIKVRYFSTTNTQSTIAIDYLRVYGVINPVYTPGDFVNVGTGTPTGDYRNTNAITSGGMTDNQILSVPGTVSSVSDFYFKLKNVRTYTGMNTIAVRAGSSCSTATAELRYRFKIRNFSTNAWEDLSNPIECTVNNENNVFAKNNITISNYINGSNEIWVGAYGSANSTTSVRIEYLYATLGTTNSNAAACEISFGSNTAGRIASNPSTQSDQITDQTIDGGYIYLAGYDTVGGDSRWRLEKRNLSDGQLVTEFATNGVYTNDPSTGEDRILSVEVNANNIYLSGYDNTPGNNQWRTEVLDITTGTLNTSFRTTGIEVNNPGTSQDRIYSNVIDSSFLYLVGEDRAVSATDSKWRIEKRFLSNGNRDTNFDTDGILTSDPTTGLDTPYVIKVDTSFIYMAGADSTGGNQWRVEKRNRSDGLPVSAFGTSGVVTSNPSAGSDEILAMEIDASFIYLAGYDSSTTNNQWRIEKRDITTGALVTGFGTNGVIQVNHSVNQDRIYGTDIDSGFLYIVGENRIESATGSRWHIEKRSITSGGLTSAFSSDGIIYSQLEGEDRPVSVDVDSSGFYVSGYSTSNSNNSWLIEKHDNTTGLPLTSTFGVNTCAKTRDIDTTNVPDSWRIQTKDETTNLGTGEANSYYAFDTDGDGTANEEAAAGNISFDVTAPEGKITGIFSSGRMLGGPSGTVQLGIKDYSGATNTLGGFSGIGSSASIGMAYFDNITVGGVSSGGFAGFQTNPEDHIDTFNNKINIRLRTTTDGSITTDSTVDWDFVMVSLQWIDDVNRPNKTTQFVSNTGSLVTGTEQSITAATTASTTGTNVGSWKGTLADDNFHWSVSSVASGTPNLNAQLTLGGVNLYGANMLMIQSEFALNNASGLLMQICDFVSSTSVDNTLDTQCTGGGWRTLNNRKIALSGTSVVSSHFQIYNGFFNNGNTAIDTPLTNFINGNNQVRVRYYSNADISFSVAIDYLRLFAVINPVYSAAGLTNTGSGTVTGDYSNTSSITNGASDDSYLEVAGTAGSTAGFYVPFKNIKTYQGMNTILVRAEHSCSSSGISYIPRIFNFTSNTWEDLTSSVIACSTIDLTNSFAKNNITISNYIAGGEVRIGWFGTANGTQAIRLDQIYITLGTTNTDTGKCEVSLGTVSSNNCSNTRTIDTTTATSSWNILTEDEAADIGTGEANSYYAYDNDGDGVSGEAAASHVRFAVTQPSNGYPTGLFFAGHFLSGIGGTVQMNTNDYSGNGTPGGFSAIGNTATSSMTYVDTINLSANTLGSGGYSGWNTNPASYFDSAGNEVWIRLRTTASGTSNLNSINQIDFAMVSMQWSETSSVVTISGNVYNNESGTAIWMGCNHTTPINNIAVSINGSSKVNGSCNAATGEFSFSTNLITASNQMVVVFLDTNGSDKAVIYAKTKDSFSNISGLKLVKNRIWLTSESSSSISNADVNVYDSDNDTDIPATVSSANLIGSSGSELHIDTGTTYAPAGNVSVDSLHLKGNYNGLSGETLSLSGSGTGNCFTEPGTIRPLCIDSGNFNSMPGTVNYNGTTDSLIEALSYTNLGVGMFVDGNAANYELSNNLSVSGTLTIGVNGSSAIDTLKASSYTLTLAGSGTPLVISSKGSFNSGTGIVKYSGISPTTIANAIYNNIIFQPSSGTVTYTLNSGTIAAKGYFNIEAGTTLNAQTNNTAIDVDNNFNIAANSTFIASSSSSFLVGRNFVNLGTFISNNGTITFDGTESSTVNGQTVFYNFKSITPGKTLLFPTFYTIQVSGLLTITGALNNPIQIQSALPGTQWKINHQGTEDITYASIKDSGCDPLSTLITLNDTNSKNTNNSFCWNFPGGPWYNTSWLKRKKITINETQIPGTTDLVNFPVLVSFTDINLRNNALITGADILFTSNNHIIKFDHQIEKYDSASGTITAWIRVPALSAVQNTDIYMYYKNPLATNQENIIGAWDSNFIGVWHLREDVSAFGDPNFLDSTSEANDATNSETGVSQISGVIYKGLQFDGSGYLNVEAEGEALDISGANTNITVCSWANTDFGPGLDEHPTIVSKGGSQYMLRLSDSNRWEWKAGNSSAYSNNSTGWGGDTWVHLCGVNNGSNTMLYVNGVLQTNQSVQTPIPDSSNPFRIGSDPEEMYQNWQGKIDEVRVSNIARSTNWITTEYNNQFSPSSFITISSQENFENGSLAVNIVDGNGVSITSPSISMSPATVSYDCQVVTGSLGSTGNILRISNSTTSAPWTLTAATTNGPASTWSSVSTQYDFNDSTGSPSGCQDGPDTDNFAGQLTLNPSAANVIPQSGCTLTGISGGSQSAFTEGSVSAITILSAGTNAQTNCYWDLTNIGVSQKIPADQGAGNYSINITFTVTAD